MTSSTTASAVLRRITTPGIASNLWLRRLLALMAVLVALRSSWLIASAGSFAVDLEIPLRAAQRFAAGGAPYLPSAFTVTAGPSLPYLYPPFVLPYLVPLLELPRILLWTTWFGVCLAAALLAIRRLGIPTLAWAFVLIWPPVFEGVWHGNVAVLMFAAFVVLFYAAPPVGPYHPDARGSVASVGSGVRDGLTAAAIAALKPSELHPWLFVVRRRPVAAVAGGLVVAAIAVATLPFTGFGLWSDWVNQLIRASDPHWILFGASTGRFLPRWLALAVTALGLLVAPFVPRRTAGLWLGLLMVVGAASLRGYDLMFLLPAMLSVRREIALIAALLVATYAIPAIWLGIALLAGTSLCAIRMPGLLEPGPSHRQGAPRPASA